ncbi:MAG: MATE family efflux transporter [Bacteroidaceae bacterium]|nr:MATE family efflux transporter [Bacteroidaceae bacterium]
MTLFRTNSHIKRQLAKLTLPILIDIALVMMLGTVDIMMLSRHSDEAVAAVGVDNQLFMLIFLVYQFISMGCAILCAQYIGAKMQKRLVQVVGVALMLNVFIGLAVSATLWFQAEGILRLIGLSENLMPEGLIYMKITGVCSFTQAISFALSASLRSADKTVYPMIVTLISNVLNFIGNYVLIFGKFGFPALGVEGAAISTALSRAVAMVLLAVFHTRKHIHSYPLEYFRPFPVRELKNLVLVGVPAMSEEMSYCLSQVVGIYMINKLGDTALATRAYCWNILAYCILFSASFTQGGSIMIGHFVGRGRNRAAYILGNYNLRLQLICCVTMAAVLASLGRPILSLFTENEEILTLGSWIFVINVFLEIGRTRNIFSCGSLRATGDTIYPVVIGITFQWLIAVGVAYVAGFWLGLGLLGIWGAFALDENTRGVILTRRWHSRKWAGKSFAV